MKLTIILIFIYFSSLSYGQFNKAIYFHIDKVKLKEKVLSDSIPIDSIKNKVFTKLKLQGYIGLEITDSVIIKSQPHYYFSYSNHFEKVRLKNGDNAQTYSIYQTYKEINDLIIELENTGYPFAKINILDLKEMNNALEIEYEIDSGSYFIISKIHIKSQDDFNEKTILNICNLELGIPYNENEIKNLENIINQNGMYQLIRPPEVLFRPKKAELFLFIKKKQTSTADGYLGFQQNKTTNKFELNGNIDLKLENGLNRAEVFNFKWKNNPNKTQALNIKFDFPYLLNLPLGIENELVMQKQDSSFLKTNYLGSIKYLSVYYKIGVFIKYENSILLIDNPLLNFRPFKKNTIGISGNYNFSRFNKYNSSLGFTVGTFNYESDSIESIPSTSNISYDFSLQQSMNFFKSFSFNNDIRYQTITANYSLSQNELIYFGGLKNVRGFYELELAGNSVFSVLNSIDYRPVKELAFQLIYDYSSFLSDKQHFTNSIGLGFKLYNDNNVLNLVIANGKLDNNRFDFQSTKLHIGLISKF